MMEKLTARAILSFMVVPEEPDMAAADADSGDRA
jgi:hypothetical protein